MNQSAAHSEIGASSFSSEGEELPLSGLLVVEFCQIAAGPFCGMLLGDMGADVIKIEPPTGDAIRQWPPITDGFSENFASVNRNKRSIALDLKNPDDSEIAKALIAKADVVLENNRPGVMDRLGLGYTQMKAVNERLIYCSISAYGQHGPRAKEGAFDVTMQAVSGIMSVTGEPGEAPVKCGVPLSDFATGLYASFNITAALLRRGRTGKGTHIDASMFGASLGIAALQTSEYFGTGRHPKKMGSKHPRNAPYQAYKASDDFFVIAAGNDRLWANVCQVTDSPELVNDPRFTSTSNRAANQDALKEILESKFAQADAQTWLDRFRTAGVPCSPINQYGDALEDPQVEAYQWVKSMQLPDGGAIRTFGAPIGMHGMDFPVRLSAPALDGNRDEIVRWVRSD